MVNLVVVAWDLAKMGIYLKKDERKRIDIRRGRQNCGRIFLAIFQKKFRWSESVAKCQRVSCIK